MPPEEENALGWQDGASFYTEGRERKACVFCFGTNDQICVLGWLKYNAALKWCEENLERGE